MDETPQPSEVFESKSASNISIEFPTTPEIVAEGIEVFEDVYHALPDDLKSMFIHTTEFRTSFIGITPQVNLDARLTKIVSTEQLKQLQDTLRNNAPQLKLYYPPHGVTGEPQIEKLSLLNISAAKHVIENHKDYFPEEALTNLEEWLFHNLNEWHGNWHDKRHIPEIRFGLLSGFPIWSVVNYGPYIDAQIALDEDLLTKEERQFLSDYYDDEYEREGLIDLKLEGILYKANPKISKDEIALFKKAHAVYNQTLGGYIGFDRIKDVAYTKVLDEIYEESGIDNLAERLAA